jgi:hypothetical protein
MHEVAFSDVVHHIEHERDIRGGAPEGAREHAADLPLARARRQQQAG